MGQVRKRARKRSTGQGKGWRSDTAVVPGMAQVRQHPETVTPSPHSMRLGPVKTASDQSARTFPMPSPLRKLCPIFFF